MVYATYTDVERAYYTLSGDNFSSTQQTSVGDAIDKVHGQILLYFGGKGISTEPTVSEGLKSVEVQGVLNILWNQDNKDKKPRPVLTPELLALLDKHAQIEDDEEEDAWGFGLIRDYEEYYGY